MKRGRRVLLLLVGIAVAAMVTALVWPRQSEPTYEGKTLSEYLVAAWNSSDWRPASNAVVHMGTNALPFLLAWLDYAPPPWEKSERFPIEEAASRKGLTNALSAIIKPAGVRMSKAIMGFLILDTRAAPAVPDLVRLLEHQHAEGNVRAIHFALSCVGEEGMAPLLGVVTNRSLPEWARADAAGWIKAPKDAPRTNFNWMAPLLIACLDEPGLTADVARALGSLRLQPETVVPLLIKFLQGPDRRTRANAAEALGRFGTNATAAVPALLALTRERDLFLRDAAERALKKIRPEGLENEGH